MRYFCFLLLVAHKSSNGMLLSPEICNWGHSNDKWMVEALAKTEATCNPLMTIFPALKDAWCSQETWLPSSTNSCNDNKQLRLSGSSNRWWQFSRYSPRKDCKPSNMTCSFSLEITLPQLESESFSSDLKQDNSFGRFSSLNPSRTIPFTLLKRPMDKCNTLTPVCDKFKYSIFSEDNENFIRLEQPSTKRLLRDLKWASLSSVSSLSHMKRFKYSSVPGDKIDGLTWHKLLQSERSMLLRFSALEKSGSSVNFWHPTRSTSFKLTRFCDNSIHVEASSGK